MRAQLQLPRLAATEDPLDHFGRFHDSLRDVLAWAPFIVEADGTARGADARFLKSFFDGPFSWHLVDEQCQLVPLLSGRRGPWLDAALASIERAHAQMEAAACALAPLLDDLARGGSVPQRAWREAVAALGDAVDRGLSFEDAVLLPTARLLLDEDERRSLADRLLLAQEARPAQIDLSTNQPRAVAAVRILGDTGRERVHSYADCPRGRTVDVEAVCSGCTHLVGAQIADGAGRIVCAIDESTVPERVADIMTRDVQCVSPAVPAPDLVRLLAQHGVHGVPVVDDTGAPVGIISQSDIVRALAQGLDFAAMTVADLMMHAVFAVDENAPIGDAATLIAFEGVHRLPVVNADRVVVGIVSALDVVRCVSRPSARP